MNEADKPYWAVYFTYQGETFRATHAAEDIYELVGLIYVEFDEDVFITGIQILPEASEVSH